jgi:hypothetical protein
MVIQLEMFTVGNMRFILSGLLLAACVLPVFAKLEKSEAMSLIMKHHLVGKDDLNIKDMPEAKDFKQPAADEDHEIYRLPTDSYMADGFSCSVILAKKLQQHWMVRSA